MHETAPDADQTQLLLQEARGGDRRAVEELLAGHRPYLRRLVELRLDPRLRSRVDASDVVQEAQLEAARRLAGYLQGPPMPFRLWLRELAYDRLVMLRRRHLGAARRSVGREVALPEGPSLHFARGLLDAGPTPSQQMQQQELADRVRAAVARLPTADREVLLMRTFEDLSFEEVAYLLGVTAETARKRHGRALLRLHRILSEGGLTESQP
jgi:RNA polymerase sigma-70 factor (ECF subfamily)